MKRKYFTGIIFFTLLSSLTFSQVKDTIKIKNANKKFIKYLDLRFENGIMLNNGTEEGSELIKKSYYNGIDFRLGFRLTDPDNVYSNVYRRPYIGVGFYTSTFHNQDIGKPSALYFFITVPFTFEKNKKLTFSYSGAFGLSYNFNPYDSIDNPTNLFIGSKKNCYFHFGFVMNYRLTDRFAMNFTTGIKHFSNGSMKKPNTGINLIPFTIGISYKLNKQDILLEKREIPKYKPHNIWNISVSVGSKHYDKDDTRNYLKMTYNVGYLRQFSYTSRIGAGIDFFYSAPHEYSNKPGPPNAAFSVALAGAYEWVINNNLSVPLGIGIYLKRHEKNEEIKPFYERAGMKYRFNNNIFLAVTIKAHGSKADFFEWTIGYALQKDQNRF